MSSLSDVVRTEFAAAINQIATERKIEPEAVLEAIRQALISAYRKEAGIIEDEMYYFVELDEGTGAAKIFEAPILEQDEETGEITSWDESKAVDVTPAGFGRIAAQTAKQVILQKIRESEKDQIISDFTGKVGEIITGQILRMSRGTVIIDLGRGQGFMPPEEQMRGEFYRLNSRITVYLKEIEDTVRGQRIIVSRADENLVSKLFEREVPEVASGAVEIVSIAREAGVRTKLAVKSTQEGVDPVGSCVGQRGVRVQEVIKELNNEKVDIIPHSDDFQLFLRGVLSPAESLQIDVDDDYKTITVTAPDEQLSLAIGRGGQNVRLAAKLVGYQITIKSAEGNVESKMTGDEEYEIDTYEGLSQESRDMLVQFKLTTVGDLARFKDKWQDMKDLADDQKELLQLKVDKFEKEMSERETDLPKFGDLKHNKEDKAEEK
ncbi:MAG: transcription termination/antitermination protein NusA [Candidatus Pacebacteria bacterium]|jgi:transcription termination/antitermination protein NusA|nr:transcription termination/antitermination protein NusA [Candidatus Paceibacterota bacterium]MBT3511482.1 transcription termination/antitermination protein NusA [Candidatus Paceibacterota bacterium]MBT4004666.1 transcription termination/antitermination protein NusA [Candidatus Paceibacterota bacterium]MBT4358416.1 transcription termination/antitermination protein NusA [Candidatus Paceibacterota bacterium]MBT4680852.1 transcription termination/antitermination protein NusA [Candidatus Paceibact